MQIEVLPNVRGSEELCGLLIDSVVAILQVVGGVHIPIRKAPLQRCQPLDKAGLTCVYLLASANKTDDSAPIWVTVHDTNEELRFGHTEVFMSPPALHEL